MWVVWRQNRRALAIALSFISILTVTTLVAAAFVEQKNSTWMFGQFCSRWNDVGPCRPETALTFTTLFALLLPVIVGVFVGVPAFARDLEQRTHVLGLTQSVSRTKWYLARVVVIFVPITAAMVCLGLSLRWASTAGGNARGGAPADALRSLEFSLYDFPIFETAGIALGGYTVFALMLGSTAALLLRSTVGAMLTTIVGFLLVPVFFTGVVRDDYGSPEVSVEPISGYARAGEYFPDPYFTTDSTWVVGAGYVDKDGSWLDPDESLCAPDHNAVERDKRPDETNDQFYARQDEQRARDAVTYDVCLRDQGVDRYETEFYTEDDYWRFQVIETGLMLVVSGATLVVGIWGVRRLRP